MPTKPLRTDLLDSAIATPTVWMGAAALLLFWMLLHWLSRRFATGKLLRWLAWPLRIAVGTAAIWTVWQAVARHLVLESSWPLWVNALVGATAIEIICGLYQLEKRIVKPSLGRWLLALRLLMTAAVLTMLVQPVFARDEERREDRNVVVLVDDSASMQIADREMPVDEKLGLAAFEGMDFLKNRPPLATALGEGRSLLERLAAAAESLRVVEMLGRDEEKTRLDKEAAAWRDLEDQARQWAARVRPAIDVNVGTITEDFRRAQDIMRRRLGNDTLEGLNQIRAGLGSRNARQLRRGFSDAAAAIDEGLSVAPAVALAADETFYTALPQDARERIDAAAARTRGETARLALTRGRDGKPSFLDQVREKYTLRLMRFGSKAAEVESLAPEAFTDDPELRRRTDLASALDKIRETWPPENLAGVVVLSDFRHNGLLPPDDAARGLGLQGSPVSAVVTGSSRGSVDAAVVSLSSPQSVFLGDRVRIRADLKADGLRGRELRVRLLKEGQTVSEQTVPVPEDSFRTTLRLADQPPEKGIFGYSVVIEPVTGELFANNNQWDFDVAVSDDRTNVLLIDDVPRWEFRYLRNLFDSRDKSVHLQHVLIHPDTLSGADALPAIPASAARKFGESEATRLPSSPEEWRKFDVIILGDLPPGTLGEETWNIIRECVDRRGAMLVVIAGPSHMPHAFTNEAARSLIPVEYDAGTAPLYMGPELSYRLALTADGRSSPIFLQSLSGVDNARIWDEIPPLSWRHPIRAVKPGASVLAWARPVVLDAAGNEVRARPAASGDLADALLQQKQTEQQNALVVTSQTGLGKVVMLNFDQTWRFRYGVGDTYHHRFWGQLMRWGAGQNLASGTNFVRLGTDRLSIEPGQPLKIMARLVDDTFRPVAGADVKAAIYRGDERVMVKNLTYREDSHGMYETEVESLKDPGAYRIELEGSTVRELLARENVQKVDQKLTVTAEGNPVELGEISVDREMAVKLASLSGGAVVAPESVSDLLRLFGDATKVVTKRLETTLWDNWMLLLVAIGAATAEWILRRKGGLV
jgi:hypothetical protein